MFSQSDKTCVADVYIYSQLQQFLLLFTLLPLSSVQFYD